MTSQSDAIPVRERAYEYLKTSILSGRLNPGERLTEEHLAKELGISRTPIREALHKLESEGLIKPLATRGFIASQDSREDVDELFEIRAVLEGYALRVICGRVTEEQLSRLDETVKQAETALQRQSLDEVFQWNTRFHDILHEVITDKRRLFHQMVTMRQYVLRYRKNTLQSLEGGGRTVDGHRKILMALRLRDADLCERVMREHIQQSKKDALQFLFEDHKEVI
ncbi:MAG: GntR family transcriptional regulator [Acidobacteriia bacterium]|nr:GntR family transcriptional regulator [Terriglobia bacterium]